MAMADGCLSDLANSLTLHQQGQYFIDGCNSDDGETFMFIFLLYLVNLSTGLTESAAGLV